MEIHYTRTRTHRQRININKEIKMAHFCQTENERVHYVRTTLACYYYIITEHLWHAFIFQLIYCCFIIIGLFSCFLHKVQTIQILIVYSILLHTFPLYIWIECHRFCVGHYQNQHTTERHNNSIAKLDWNEDEAKAEHAPHRDDSMECFHF